MGRRREDGLDILLYRWGRQRQALLGMRNPDVAWPHSWQWIGAPDCTLANVREMQDGASSGGVIRQHYPEVYLGLEFEVNRAFNHMAEGLRNILDTQYRIKGKFPQKVEILAERENRPVSKDQYWKRLAIAKAYIDAWIARGKENRDLKDAG